MWWWRNRSNGPIDGRFAKKFHAVKVFFCIFKVQKYSSLFWYMAWLLYFVVYFDTLNGIWYFILKYILMYLCPTLAEIILPLLSESHNHTEPFKGHCGGKNSGWVEKNSGWEEKIFFKCFAFSRKTFAFPRETLRSLAKLLRSLAKIFAFPRKTFAFSRKYFFFFKFCEGTQISLRENAKVLRENAKFLEGTQKFCERTQNIWKIFFPPTLNFFHSLWFFPTTMSFKGLRIIT